MCAAAANSHLPRRAHHCRTVNPTWRLSTRTWLHPSSSSPRTGASASLIKSRRSAFCVGRARASEARCAVRAWAYAESDSFVCWLFSVVVCVVRACTAAAALLCRLRAHALAQHNEHDVTFFFGRCSACVIAMVRALTRGALSFSQHPSVQQVHQAGQEG